MGMHPIGGNLDALSLNRLKYRTRNQNTPSPSKPGLDQRLSPRAASLGLLFKVRGNLINNTYLQHLLSLPIFHEDQYNHEAAKKKK